MSLSTGMQVYGKRLRKILDCTRFASIFIWMLHFLYCYAVLKYWKIKCIVTDNGEPSKLLSGDFRKIGHDIQGIP